MLTRRLLLGTVAVSILFAANGIAQAIEKFKVGEEVKVFHLRSWIEGTVVAINARGDVQTDYQFAGGTHRGVFKNDEVRHLYEADALSRGRNWTDTTGKFRVKAALMVIYDTEVSLRKEDLTLIDIPLEKLSEGDRRFIKTVQSQMKPESQVPAGPEPPAWERFADDGQFGSARSFDGDGSVGAGKPIAPDPIPSYLRFKQGGVAFPEVDLFDRLGAIIPVGGKDSWLLACVVNGSPRRALPSRLLWVSLAKQKVERTLQLPPAEEVLDYHSPSKRLLTANSVQDMNKEVLPALTLWETSPTEKELNPIVRWVVKSDFFKSKTPWAYLVSGSIVVQQSASQEYVAWNVDEKKMLYRIQQESFFAPKAVLSGGGKYLFLPEDKQIRVIESATGKTLRTLLVKHGCSAVAPSDDGRQLAALDRNSLHVWDLTAPDAVPKSYQAEAIGTGTSTMLAWVNEERLMADARLGLSLFSLKNNITLWNYTFDSNAIREREGRVRAILNGHLIYAATVGQGVKSGLAVGAVELPGPKVDETEAALDPESLFVITPGTEVRVEVKTGEHDARIKKALENKIKANGWVLKPDAEAVLSAEMTRGKQQTVTYQFWQVGPNKQPNQTVSVIPYVSSLTLRMGEVIVWGSGTSTGPPSFMHLKQGQTAQAEVDKWQLPNPDFFEGVEIPPKIKDPAKRNGLGTTQVTNRGLVIGDPRPARPMPPAR